MKYKPKNILVTGGAGFIGCNFIRYLLESDSEIKIINIDNLSFAGDKKNLESMPSPDRHMFIKMDITDKSAIKNLFHQHEIDTVVHFAAESHVDRSITGPEVFVQSNVMGTFVLLEAARQYWQEDKKWDATECRFHHISTDEVYGTLDKSDPPFTEESTYAPNSPYSASKAGSDHMVRAYFHTYGLPVTTTNCSNNYGAYQHGEKFIPTVIRSCLNNQTIPIYGDGTNIRDWLYVDDHCSAIDKVVRTGKLGETYNIGGNNEWSNNAIAETICKILDKKVPSSKPYAELMQFVEDRKGHDWRYAIDGTKITRDLQWQPAVQFEEGIEKTIDWYLVNKSCLAV